MHGRAARPRGGALVAEGGSGDVLGVHVICEGLRVTLLCHVICEGLHVTLLCHREPCA